MAFGIPSLLNQVAQVTNNIALVSADVANVLNMFVGPQWGIGQNGLFVLTPDSIISVDLKKDWHLPDYPMEPNSFGNYNKVNTPFDVRVQMTKGGTVAERSAFLDAVETIAQSTDLYDVVMPERVLSNVNVTHFDYRRTSTAGAGLLTVDLWLIQIRIAAAPSYANTAQPSGADPVNTGTVQPQPPASNQSAAASVFT